MKQHVYKIALVLILIWIGLMIWDNTLGLPDMNPQMKNMLIWFPTLIIGFVWAFSGKRGPD